MTDYKCRTLPPPSWAAYSGGASTSRANALAFPAPGCPRISTKWSASLLPGATTLASCSHDSSRHSRISATCVISRCGMCCITAANTAESVHLPCPYQENCKILLSNIVDKQKKRDNASSSSSLFMFTLAKPCLRLAFICIREKSVTAEQPAQRCAACSSTDPSRRNCTRQRHSCAMQRSQQASRIQRDCS